MLDSRGFRATILPIPGAPSMARDSVNSGSPRGPFRFLQQVLYKSGTAGPASGGQVVLATPIMATQLLGPTTIAKKL